MNTVRNQSIVGGADGLVLGGDGDGLELAEGILLLWFYRGHRWTARIAGLGMVCLSYWCPGDEADLLLHVQLRRQGSLHRQAELMGQVRRGSRRRCCEVNIGEHSTGCDTGRGCVVGLHCTLHWRLDAALSLILRFGAIPQHRIDCDVGAVRGIVVDIALGLLTLCLASWRLGWSLAVLNAQYSLMRHRGMSRSLTEDLSLQYRALVLLISTQRVVVQSIVVASVGLCVNGSFLHGIGLVVRPLVLVAGWGLHFASRREVLVAASAYSWSAEF